MVLARWHLGSAGEVVRENHDELTHLSRDKICACPNDGKSPCKRGMLIHLRWENPKSEWKFDWYIITACHNRLRYIYIVFISLHQITIKECYYYLFSCDYHIQNYKNSMQYPETMLSLILLVFLGRETKKYAVLCNHTLLIASHDGVHISTCIGQTYEESPLHKTSK